MELVKNTDIGKKHVPIYIIFSNHIDGIEKK